jgi:hypothetical protein
MNNAREKLEMNAGQRNRDVAAGLEGRGRAAQQVEQLDVHFVNKSAWDLALKKATGPKAEVANQRVLRLSQYTDAVRHESQRDSAFTRKIAWAMIRARAAAQCLVLT